MAISPVWPGRASYRRRLLSDISPNPSRSRWYSATGWIDGLPAHRVPTDDTAKPLQEFANGYPPNRRLLVRRDPL
jgi:hypothetical protein